jgi:hypothetical protein
MQGRCGKPQAAKQPMFRVDQITQLTSNYLILCLHALGIHKLFSNVTNFFGVMGRPSRE